MSDVAESLQERVCPRCGVPAQEADYCEGCGLHIGALSELPTRAEWMARVPSAPEAQAGAAGISPAGPPTRVIAPPPQRVAISQAPSSLSGFRSSSSIAPLLHPTEASRLALALIASAIALLIPLILVIQAGGFGVLLEVLTVVVVTVWIGIQLSRARLLGRSVRVDPNTFPELNAIVAEVSATLDYRRRIEVYVTDKVPQSIVTTSLLGTRMIIIEGGLVADLLKPGKQPQLTFLVGRSIGALSARHERLELLIRIMEAAEVLKYVAPFIRPYYRATAYSGDQIGMMCCSDLEAALEATRRLLVGPEMASQLTAGAVVPQAKFVKERVLPRLVQLLAVEPHVTNRYANLLCFGRYHTPDLWAAMSSSMDEHEQRCLEEIWQGSAYRWRVAAG